MVLGRIRCAPVLKPQRKPLRIGHLHATARLTSSNLLSGNSEPFAISHEVDPRNYIRAFATADSQHRATATLRSLDASALQRDAGRDMEYSLSSRASTCKERLPDWSPRPSDGDKVFLAMSGGVDSSVMALLLSQQPNLSLFPVYMRNWSTLEESNSFEPGSGGAAGCEWQAEWESVQDVCQHLKLPNNPQLIDLSKDYWASVFEPSLDDWGSGLTPNPDVLCNREIKFGALLNRLIPSEDRLSQMQLDHTQPKTWLATGHYARLAYPSQQDSTDPELHRASSADKDQSYFLSSVPSSALRHALFPLAGLHKPEVKKIAAEWGLPTAAKKESMGLCFVGLRGRASSQDTQERDPSAGRKKGFSLIASAPSFGGWLSSYLPSDTVYTAPGPYISCIDGSVLGHHKGLHHLTIGQRARLHSLECKWFITKKSIVDGEARAIIAPGSNHPLLLCTKVTIPSDRFHWIARGKQDAPKAGETKGLLAQIRHRGITAPCEVSVDDVSGLLSIAFKDQERLPKAVCPGQVVALYDGTRCLGSAVVPDGSVTTLGDEQEMVEVK